MIDSIYLDFWNYQFLEPWWFLLLLLIPIQIFFQWWKVRKRTGDWKLNTELSQKTEQQQRTLQWIRRFFLALPILATVFLVLALARPFHWKLDQQKFQENKYGIDIILALDVSLSMYTTDFSPNRLTVAKQVASEFIKGRSGDKIGLVLYSGEAYTACPATLNYDLLLSRLRAAKTDNLKPGTAIGLGLGTSIAQLRDKNLKSKVIILLTDGSNNMGKISPKEAAMIAQQKNICVHTVGIGSTRKDAPIVGPDGEVLDLPTGEMDEASLQEIASLTGGQYFKADDETSLREIYQTIDQMEKRKIQERPVSANPPPTPDTFLILSLLSLVLYVFMNEFVYKDSHE